jgi:O-antigen/teichoic acid export membrane protein
MKFFRITDLSETGTAHLVEDADIRQDAATAPAATSRNRSLLFATATSGLAKVVSVIINAITIPIVVRTLGADGYGLWTTITSISSFLVFADFGLSNGLVAVISEANGKRDRNAAIHAVSTTFFVLLALAAALSVLVVAGGPLVPWAGLLKLTHSRLAPDLNAAVVWFVVLQIANVPALVSQKVQMGYQEMHWTNSWQILGSVLSFAGVLLAAWKGLGLVQFIVLFSVGPLLAQMLASYVLFARLRPWLAPGISAFQWHCVRSLSGTGGIFCLLQLLAVLGNSSDQIVLARYLGLAAVAEYSLAQRLFSGASIIQFFLLPLWPAFGEAVASGDHVWARMALRRTLWISMAASATGAALIAVLAPSISKAWVPQIQRASPLLLLGFVAVALIGAYGGTMSVFLNNRKTIRAQLGYYTVGSFAALFAKLWLVKTLGISGVLWGTFLGYGLFYTYPSWRLARRTLDDLRPSELQNV